MAMGGYKYKGSFSGLTVSAWVKSTSTAAGAIVTMDRSE